MTARFPDQDPSDPWSQPSYQQPWPARPEADAGRAGGQPGGYGWPDQSAYWARPPLLTRADLSAALIVTAMSLVSGVAAGFAWHAFAPKIEMVVRGDSAIPAQPEGEALIGVDGRFGLIAAGAGVLGAIVAFLWFRRRSIGVVCALLAAGYLAARLAAYVGGWLGPDALSTHLGEPDGTRFLLPLQLRATGVMLLWPIAALLVYLALTLLFDRDDRPPEDGWNQRW
ncbi:MAG: hypothetical protein L0Y54_16190 [Sporichthyaceae bacterium]|nr:hypothetical protein [Sporichthyaceae bacterium]